MRYLLLCCLPWIGILAWAGTPLIQDLMWDCIRPVYVIAGDLDGNGWDDIAVACHSCDMVLLGLNPKGQECPVSWGSPKALKLTDSPMALEWGLFGKGVGPYHKKIVVVTQYKPAWGMFSAKDSSVSLKRSDLVTISHLTVGDFNEDGSLDVVLLDPLGLVLSFPMGAISDIDLSPYTDPGVPSFVNKGDFDRDADLDLVVSSGTKLLFFENQGEGNFALRIELSGGLLIRATAVADLDGDGDQDLAFVDPKFGTLAILENKGCWEFKLKLRIKLDKGPVFVIPFDCDRDNDIDLAVAEYEGDVVAIATNNGQGGFTISRTFSVGKNPIGLAVGDFDRNGIPDLVVALHGGGPSGEGPALQVIYNPCCALDDCTKQAPCCEEGVSPPPPCGGS